MVYDTAMTRQDTEATAAASTPPVAERLEALINDFSAALRDGVGALFVGAGVSGDAGLPSWSELLRGPAEELGIQLDPHRDDLAAVAQYYVNRYCGNRGPLVRAVMDRIGDFRRLSPMHEAISRMNLSTVWTTNYDTLLEAAFRGFNVSVRVRDDEVRRTVPSHEVEIVKLHGCMARSRPDELVITLEDYEDYFQGRPGISRRFETALQDRMFLFLGYSYRDPNIHSLVTQARRVLKGATRKHYMLQFQEEEPAPAARQKLWANDLMRFGIECVLVDGAEQTRSVLDRIAERCRGATVYVTGSHKTGDGDPAALFASELGQQLALLERLMMLDGQSEGTGRFALTSFMTQCIEGQVDLDDRLHLFANPYAANQRFAEDKSLLPMLKKWRARLMQAAAIVIAIDGGMGTSAEVEVACERGCGVIRLSAVGANTGRAKLCDDETTKSLLERAAEFCPRATSEGMTAEEVSQLVARALRLAVPEPRG